MVRIHGIGSVDTRTRGRRRSPLPPVRPVAILLVLASAVVLAAPLGASQNEGRWLPNTLPDPAYKMHYATSDGLQVGTHVAVLRGEQDSTVILYWHSPDETFVMTHWDQGYPALPVFGAVNRKKVKPPLASTRTYSAPATAASETGACW